MKAEVPSYGSQCFFSSVSFQLASDLLWKIRYWQEKGWIYHEDPRGWFQWYCRYYMGRRCLDDDRQIKRWRSFKRHRAQVQRHCRRGDRNCRPRQRQALLQWAYDFKDTVEPDIRA